MKMLSDNTGANLKKKPTKEEMVTNTRKAEQHLRQFRTSFVSWPWSLHLPPTCASFHTESRVGKQRWRLPRSGPQSAFSTRLNLFTFPAVEKRRGRDLLRPCETSIAPATSFLVSQPSQSVYNCCRRRCLARARRSDRERIPHRRRVEAARHCWALEGTRAAWRGAAQRRLRWADALSDDWQVSQPMAECDVSARKRQTNLGEAISTQ